MKFHLHPAWLAVPLAVGVSACGGSDSPGDEPGAAIKPIYVFNGEDEDLNIYDAAHGFKKRVVNTGNPQEELLTLPALNGQICFDPANNRHFIMCDDAGQRDPSLPLGPAGWSFLEILGSGIDDFTIKPLGTKLIPTYQKASTGVETYGCGWLPDGRVLTGDLGNQAAGDANGQITMFFPPFEATGAIGSQTKHFCKLDETIGTTGGMYIDKQQRIYVASARATPGIYRYTGPFPTGDDAAHGCGKTDALGSPMADAVQKELFIKADNHVATPISIVGSNHDTFYVASVANGVIAEYDANGKYVQTILKPPLAAALPYTTGTPQGLGVDSAGSIYYADIGLVVDKGGVGPGDKTGSLRRIRIVDGHPQEPETMDTGLNFPDGIGVWEP